MACGRSSRPTTRDPLYMKFGISSVETGGNGWIFQAKLGAINCKMNLLNTSEYTFWAAMDVERSWKVKTLRKGIKCKWNPHAC